MTALKTAFNVNGAMYKLFYKNNFIRTTRLKFAQKLRTSSEQLRLGFIFKCN